MTKKIEKNKKTFILKIAWALFLVVFSLSVSGQGILSMNEAWASTANNESEDDYGLHCSDSYFVVATLVSRGFCHVPHQPAARHA